MIAAFSSIRSVNTGEGVFAWLSFFLGGSFLFISSLIFSRYPHGFRSLSYWALVAGIGLLSLGIAEHYNNLLPSPFFFKGIMVNKNLYASSLFLFLPFFIYNMVSGQKIWRRIAMIFLPILCALILIFWSRAVLLAMIFAAVPVIILMFHSPLNYTWKKGGGLLRVTLFLLVLIGIFFPRSIKNYESVQVRFDLWNSTVKMIRHDLLLGIGPGQWRLVLPEYYKPMVKNGGSLGNTEISAQRPHNDFLWVMAETGILGAISYLLFFGILYYYAVKIVEKADDEKKIFVLSMIYGIGGYFIIAMFSYPRERPLHTLLLMLMAAGVVSCYHGLYPVKTHRCVFWVPIAKCVILLLLVGFCLDSGIRLYSEIQFKKALQAGNKEEWQQVIGHIDQVILPFYSIDPFGVPLLWYRGMADYSLNDFSAALDDFKSALDYHPYHGHSRKNMAIIEKMLRFDND